MPTRREFVRNSLLAGATAALAGSDRSRARESVAAGPPNRRPEVDGHLGSSAAPYPLIPYGSGTPIYLADLDRCEPASALATTWQPYHWKVYPFATARMEGSMIAAGQNTGVPELEYPLAQKGWYAISFGILSKYWESRLQVRFKDEEVFSLLTPNDLDRENLMWDDIQWSKHTYRSPDIEELFWRYAELGGEHTALVLSQLKVRLLPDNPDAFGNIFHPCWLAYIKLVPLSAGEEEKLQADRKRRDTRRLYAADDALTPTFFLHFQNADDVRRQLEPYRNTDFVRMYWESGGGDTTNYPSKIAKLMTFDWVQDHYRLGDRLTGETFREFAKRGLDAFGIAVDYSHHIGLEFHASYRVSGFKFPPPEDEWNAGGMYDQHPEWRGQDRQGRTMPRLSYVYPGVREYVISIQEEVVRRYPVDGICLLYNRRLPIIGYEPPLVEAFRRRHGVDPRTLDEKDPRWLALSAEVLTEFMRELRRRLRAEAARQKRGPIGISACVMGSQAENYGYGLDLDAWVREGLVDTLMPYSNVPGGDSHQVSWDDAREIEYFVRLTRNTSCRLAPNLMPRGISPEDYKRRADALYRAGVENLYFWDCFDRINFDPSWTTLSRLGHKEELAAWRAQGSPPVERPRQAPTKIGDWDLSYVTPG